ncbi:MAG: type II secretion system GspH family protein [Turneriella sp.]|nr:type II secretion system GspH family protein [Leptospiraceae bacterium]MCX7632572.1 type II secretion system GspH family protein [Turneriella sp.]
MKTNRAIQSQRGFTLVELLIVIGLSGFIFVTLMAIYLQVKKLTYEQTRVASQSAAVIDFGVAISYDLANLIFEKYNTRQVFLIERELHGGKRFDAFVFPSAALYSNPSVLQSRSFMVAYFVERDRDGRNYTLYRSEDMFVDPRNLYRGVPVPMVRFVEEFKVEGSNNGVDFEEGWDYRVRRQIPRYVRITLQYRVSETSDTISTYTIDVRPPIMWN